MKTLTEDKLMDLVNGIDIDDVESSSPLGDALTAIYPDILTVLTDIVKSKDVGEEVAKVYIKAINATGRWDPTPFSTILSTSDLGFGLLRAHLNGGFSSAEKAMRTLKRDLDCIAERYHGSPELQKAVIFRLVSGYIRRMDTKLTNDVYSGDWDSLERATLN